jgi:DNA repair protein RecN (Recombination protein N)
VLERLEVHGLGIIDAVTLELEAGLGVLTGETGAGKSLLVESLKLLSGERAQTDLVRTGDDRLRVQGWFSIGADEVLREVLADLEVAAEEELVLRREVASAGRNRCFINDVSVTAASLQRIAPRLLAIHGQHEQHGLSDPEVQRRLVDDFGGLWELGQQVRVAHRAWSHAASELERLRAARDRRRDRMDVIGFQLAEIDGVAPRPGEEEELAGRRLVLRHAVRLLELSGAVLGRLADDDGAAVDALARAERDVDEMGACGLDLGAAVARLAEARVQVEEVVREIRPLADGIGEDPAELDDVETRLHRLEQLMLKYGSPLEEVLAHRERLLSERGELEQVEDSLERASVAANAALAAYDDVAAELDEARRESGDRLVAAVSEVLDRLNMEGTVLEFRWQARSDDASPLRRNGRGVAFGPDGVAECELYIAPNPGEEPRPMARIASGGELSRIHLALRTVLLGRERAAGRTLLFDEVDSGLGGATAAALGALLGELAEEHQVLVVTHLPQVAAAAGSHFLIEKVRDGGRAVTRATRLDSDQRELELARMLAGDEVTASARAHARALLEDR